MAKLDIQEEVLEALKKVRDDKEKTNFVVAGFDDSQPNKTLALFGSGEDGVDGLKTFVKADDVCYCLLRVDFNYETVGNVKADSTRFLFIYYRPENIPLKRKMILGSVEGKIKKAFSPFIRATEIDSMDKLSAQGVSDIIDEITMTKSKVTERKAFNGILIDGKMVPTRSDVSDKKNAQLAPDSRAKFVKAKGADVKFSDEDQLKDVIAQLRDDSNEMKWCLFSYQDKKTIVFENSGDGDVSSMLEACPDDKICYGLFRLTENYSSGRNAAGQKTVKIDQVKFGFVVWAPSTGISPTMRALVSTHKGEVVARFRPFHHQFYIENRSELDHEKALDVFSSFSGTKSKVTDRKMEKKEEKYERKFVGGASAEVQKLQFDNKEELKEGIKEVRNDETETDWVLAAFVGEKKNISLQFKQTGTGVESLTDALSDTAVQYALIRSSATVDGYETTKFTLAKIIGADINISLKGATGVFHGAVTEEFGQAHTNIAFNSKEEFAAKFSA